MTEINNIFECTMIELFRESIPSINNILDHLKTVDSFDPRSHKIDFDKYNEIVLRHTRKLKNNDQTSLMFALMNQGPSMN